MQWVNKESAMCYADERITIKRADDHFILFTGIIRDLKFYFNFSADNIKENNSVHCNIPVVTECKYYPFHILGASVDECKGQYDRMYEDTSKGLQNEEYSQHIFIFENSNGEILFTAKLLKHTPRDWFETYGGVRRQRPPYDLLHHEKIQGIGYAENIYLHPIKQLIAAGMSNVAGDVKLTCDFGEWYYALEEHITLGKLTYPNGRTVIIKDTGDDIYWRGKKIFRPGVVVKDYVELGGEKIWYVASYSSSSNDGGAGATIIFQSKNAEDALLRFEGSFVRQSAARIEKVPGKIRGYIAYYQVVGTIFTVDRNGNKISENINLYSDESRIEEIAISTSKHEVFAFLNELLRLSENRSVSMSMKSIGLDDLVGMAKVKQVFEEFKTFGEYKRALALSCDELDNKKDGLLALYKQKIHPGIAGNTSNDTVSLHMAFLGSPGTGKSTVAERIASMLKDFGLVVTNDVPIIVVKSDLVGRYIGHTEEIVRNKIEEAMGGILFVDEAYTLFESDSSNDFGRIALNEIMYAMEQHRDKLVVILAGYTDEMLHMLKNANPGLTSRIPWYFYFEDYSVDEMWEILIQKVDKNGYKFDLENAEAIKSRAKDYFTILKKEMDSIKEDGRTKHFFGNGRGVRTFFQYMQIGLAVRLGNDNYADLHTFKVDEIDFAYNTFKRGAEKLTEEKTTKARIGFHNS